jgi:hypothetical protein
MTFTFHNSSLSSLSQSVTDKLGLCWLWCSFSLSASLYRQTDKLTPRTAGNLQGVSCSTLACDKLKGNTP